MTGDLRDLAARHPRLEPCLPQIEAAYRKMEACYRDGGKLLLCGNGGSAADCEHVVGELMKGFLSKRPLPAEQRRRLERDHPDDGGYLADHLQGALPAISLVSQSGLMTAYANDVAADMVLAQQVYGYGREGDVLVAISTSGNSRNIVYAARVGRTLGLSVVGFTGRDGGVLADLCDVCIRVPEDETSAVQELQLPIYHALCGMLERSFFPEGGGK